jgi:hypothetical protein
VYALPDRRPRGIVKRRQPSHFNPDEDSEMRDDQAVEVESTELLRALIENEP